MNIKEAWDTKKTTPTIYRKEYATEIKIVDTPKDNVNVGQGGDTGNGIGFN